MKSNGYKSLDLNVLKSKKSTIVSYDVALKDVIPIQWSEEVINGEKKVLVTKENEIFSS